MEIEKRKLFLSRRKSRCSNVAESKFFEDGLFDFADYLQSWNIIQRKIILTNFIFTEKENCFFLFFFLQNFFIFKLGFNSFFGIER